MSLPSPNLDDRSFDQLVEEARRYIQQSSPAWTDLSPGDPGMVLLEVFAHLTETMIYRLNRLPEKAYSEFLNLIGVRIHPPAAASVTLHFSRSGATGQPIEIPRGARITVARTDGTGEPPLFTTARTVAIAAGETTVDVLAHHCDLVEGELAGVGTGLAGLTVQARRPPIVAPTGDELDLIVGVEMDENEAGERAPAIRHEDKVYRVWRAVDNFTNLGPDGHVYIVDRLIGQITFAPATRIEQPPNGDLTETPRALAEIPPAGREIRLWYRRGGGSAGNVAADTLTVLKEPIAGVEVTNPAPATGGQVAETLENALTRGPQELHSLHRAVTARDFEGVALYSSRGVARAKAITRAALWAHATPGAVEVLLTPYLPEAQRLGGQVTVATLQAQETEPTRQRIEEALAERRPLGTSCVVNWARYKPVRVKARIVVRRQENQTAVRQRVIERLHGTINPLPTPFSPAGWPFGQALRASHVYDMALAEPGVLWVDQVRLLVEEAPNQAAAAVAADLFQDSAWHAASGATLFRSLNNGEGWEPTGRFAEEQIELVRTHPDRAGLLAVVTRRPAGVEGQSRIYISYDCGESWQPTPVTTGFRINDLAWTLRDRTPILLLATGRGLYELRLEPGGSPVQVLVDLGNQDLGFYAVIGSRDVRGQTSVAVAAESTGGVYLSAAGGQRNTFRRIDNLKGDNPQGEDIRVLAVQYDGPRAFLWAGAAAAGGDAGKGCFRWELLGSQDPPEGWQSFGQGWNGGSCRSLAFLGGQALAASHRGGVLRLNAGDRAPQWERPDVRCGLPLRDPGPFQPVDTVAAAGNKLVMAGGVEGVFRSTDGGVSYRSASGAEFPDKVTLPLTWLFCSGAHEITVVSEDEAERD